MNGTKTSEQDNSKNNANNNENNVVIKKHTDKLEPRSEIIKFFSGRNVFITGGSGYLGRVLIFKLLAYCPGIGRVYLLMRKKKGKGPAERLSEMKEHFLFRKIDETLPGQLDKLRIVEGDCQVRTHVESRSSKFGGNFNTYESRFSDIVATDIVSNRL